MKQFIFFCFLLLNVLSSEAGAGEETWTGRLKLNDSITSVFNFDLKREKEKVSIIIHNADERILVDDITETKDSLNFKMPVFDSEFKCKKTGDSLSGFWLNRTRPKLAVFVFSASKKISKQSEARTSHSPFNGKWEVTFSPNTKDENKGLGLFEDESKNKDLMKGTILTESGDYRYLAGIIQNNNLYFSCFDGAHALVFKAKLNADGSLDGNFWLGNHWYEKWTARRNDKFELRNPDSLTYLKPGYEKLEFSFPDLQGKKVSLTDEKYKNKVVIVQIMGSWCPNCMDEMKFFSGFYEKKRTQGLEIIGLAYERTADFTKAVTNVERMKKRFNCNYATLIAATTSDKAEASKTLPALNSVMSFPTTIFIDKKGKVRKIYTGFNGPATGKYYEKYVDETDRFVQKLLKE